MASVQVIHAILFIRMKEGLFDMEVYKMKFKLTLQGTTLCSKALSNL